MFIEQELDVLNIMLHAGGHAIGAGHCNLFNNRLYSFTGKGDLDPSLNPTDAALLRTKCKSLNDATTTVKMDPGSSQGLFRSDAALLTNKISSRIVGELSNSNVFYRESAQSMKRMGAIGVLTGTSGEIRKKCSDINS